MSCETKYASMCSGEILREIPRANENMGLISAPPKRKLMPMYAIPTAIDVYPASRPPLHSHVNANMRKKKLATPSRMLERTTPSESSQCILPAGEGVAEDATRTDTCVVCPPPPPG